MPTNLLFLVLAVLLSLLLASPLWARTDPSDQSGEAETVLVEHQIIKTIGFNSYGGSVYAVYDLIGRRRQGDGEMLYMIAETGEFVRDGEKFLEKSGAVSPIAVKIRDGKVISADAPGLGGHYAPDVKRLFPLDLQRKVLNSESSPKLQEMLREKVSRACAVDSKKVVLSSD